MDEFLKKKNAMQEMREASLAKRQGVTVTGVTRGASPTPAAVLNRANSSTGVSTVRRTSGSAPTVANASTPATGTPAATPSPSTATPAGGSGSRRGTGGSSLPRPEPARIETPADGNWQALYESEVKIRHELEQELFSLRGASDSAAGGSARELSITKTELKVLKMKYDTEVKKRETLEKEIAKLKETGPAPATPAGTASTPATSTSGKSERVVNLGGGPTRAGVSSRASNRMSVMKPSNAPNIIETITRVLAEMEKLEGNIKRAEAGREKAEAELLEVAMYKQASDEALQTLINDLTASVNTLGNSITSLASSIKAGATRGDLETGIQLLERSKNEINLRLSSIKSGETINEAEIARRTNDLASKLSDPPAGPGAPPPAPGPAPAPPPPGPSGSGPTRATRPVRSGTAEGGAGSRASTLLSQIRKGKDLNKIDINAIKQERQLTTSNSRTSMALLSSLQATLRAALNARQDEMNLYGDENEGDDWDE